MTFQSRLKGAAAPIALSIALAAQPAFAQDDATNNAATATTQANDTNSADNAEIVVTGSRIRRDNFNTASPVDIIDRDQRILAGSRSTAETLQAASITSGTAQINGSFLGYVSEGGPAADTIGLRGLSSSRTLVLLNGRRLAPAGVGPQLVAADLNTLPTAVVQRVEVLREGASSVYGSDAIAGVVNVITDTKVDGVTVDAFTDQPVEHGGGGRTYRASIVAGKTFDRGYITAAFEYRERTGLRLGDRSEFSCPRDLFYDPTTGQEVGSTDTATGQLACFPYTTGGGSGIASGYGIASGSAGTNRITFNNGDINSLGIVNGIDRVSPNKMQLLDHIVSPVKTYTGYLNGAYELDMLGDAEIYGEALFTRRESHQDSTYQLNIDPAQLSPNIEVWGGSYAGYPIQDYGYPNSPFFPNSLASAGYYRFTPFVIPNREYSSSQKIDFVRANGGLRGNLGLGDWRYDANFQYSQTKAQNAITLIPADHLSNALQTVLAPSGTPDDLVTHAIAGEAGAGNGYTCASNVDSGGAFIAGSTCAPLDMFNPDVFLNGNIPDAVYNYLFQNEVDRTRYEEDIASLNLDGTLFDLPGGAVKMALGYEHRHDYIKDIPSEDAQTGNLYNYSSGSITEGNDNVDEVYGELGVPLLKDKPGFYDLELNLSGRYTHYRSYGSDFTYHINAQWAPFEVLRFRGNYGTSFRAPNLFEQYVADQTGFFGGDVDPCSGFGTAYNPGDTVYDNCLAALSPILGAGTTAYIATAGPKVITRGGHGLLDAEHSRSWGFGGVLTLPPSVANFSFAVDYWNVRVKGEITTLANLILDRCYEADDFPNNQYCDLISARRPASDPQAGTLSEFLNPYLNVSEQAASGIDFDVRYQTHIANGAFVLRAQATRNLHQYYQLFETDPKTDYNGTLGTQGFGAGPKWVGNLDLEYTVPSGNVTFHYGVQYVGPQDSTDLAGPATAPFLGAVNTDLHAETYWEHGVSVQVKFQDVGQVTLGVNNLFNRLPPTISSFPTSAGQYPRVGNFANSSDYDYIGRSVFLNFTRTFK